MNYLIREMMLSDYDNVLNLWNKIEHLDLNECDSREGMARYLARNPGLCFIAEYKGKIIGTVMCGHDGRRGILRHLAIDKAHRGLGLSRKLVNNSLHGLASQGIGKCNIFVEDKNDKGLEFWAYLGWAHLEYTYRTLQTSTDNTKI